jgi:hypothetical protein
MRTHRLFVVVALSALAWGCGASPQPGDPAGNQPEARVKKQSNPADCNPNTLAALPPSPEPSGTPILLAADAGCVSTPESEYRFLYKPIGGESCGHGDGCGPWLELRGYGESTFTFDTTGLTPGRYRLRAQGRTGNEGQSTRTITYELTEACAPGYASEGFDVCVDINECLTNNGGCDPLTTCTNLPGSRECGPCPSGYFGNGETGCTDIDECATNNGACDPLTSCTNTPGSRLCGPCPSGYDGTGEIGCTDIDECATGNGACDSLTVCINLPGSRACGPCPGGYAGTGELGCTDIDECATANGGCDPLTVCTNLPGSRTCSACPTGYTGTGETACTDIDECATANGGCDPLTVCTNLPGSRTCGPCPTGYTGTGETACTDIDECATANGGCDSLTTCTNTPGGRTCGPCPTGNIGSGDTACIALVASEIVGRPTAHSVTINLMAGQSLEAYVEYGTAPDSYAGSTPAGVYADGIVEAVVDGLAADTLYYYRMRYRPSGATTPFLARDTRQFRTQPPSGATFTFAVQSDSHQGYAGFYSDPLYRITMGNIAGEHPDFLVDLGDTVSTDGTTETQATVRQKYLDQRTIFDLAAHSMPVFLALGNHENEEGWNLDDFGANRQNSLPVLGANARKRYFLNPVPDSFYSGNTDATVTEIDGDHLKEDYYAFTWGDALFVVIDPFWYTMKKPYASTLGGEKQESIIGDRWDWTLGDQQYQWLKQVLESSPATFKFVFAHQATGGLDDYIRGGALGAKYCEWGGYDANGVTWAFESHRPGWEMPIHQLFVHTNVTAFFHGHDHVFAKEELDGVVYQEVPFAANSNYGDGFDTNPEDYAGGVLRDNSGHLRVTVAPTNVAVDYVRSFLPADIAKGTNGEVAYSYVIEPCAVRGDPDNDGIGGCSDECPNDASKTAPGQCGCGQPDADSDGDGAASCRDGCPDDPSKLAPGSCGCGRPDIPDCCPAGPGQCSPSTFMVVHVGTGSAALTTAPTAVFIEERNVSDGAVVSTIPLPTAVSGEHQPLTLAGSAFKEGTLKRSVDKHYLTMAGYAAVPGTTPANVAQTASASVNRVVARVAADRTIDTRTRLTSAFSGTSGNNANPRGAATADGTAFWVAGAGPNNTGGLWRVGFATTTATQILGQSGNNPNSLWTCDIFGGQLYGTSNTSTYYGVFTIGSGLPDAQASAVILPGFPTSGAAPTPSPDDFAVLDRDPAVEGFDTIYVTDDRSTANGGGIQKWLFNGTSWSRAYTLGTGTSGGARHLLVADSPAGVLLLAVTAPTSGVNAILKLTDTGSDSTPTTVATAANNTAFRGLALPPVP